MENQEPNVGIKEALAQLEVARNEIKNLRSQIISMKFSFRKDADAIQNQINIGLNPEGRSVEQPESSGACSCELSDWRSIGVINTWFPGRRGLPRQASLSPEAQGVLTLSPTVINNPAFSLSGLEEFSHIWILFHFHQTAGSHVKTKVAPPRLGGARVGVFGTRSPHRPCPIGLSLVKLDRIEGHVVYFSGVDMVDGTPVLDIKPYIPQYDDPRCLPARMDGSLPLDEAEPEESNVAEENLGDSEAAQAAVSAQRHVEGEAGAELIVLRSTPDDLHIDLSAALTLSGDGAAADQRASRPPREAPDGEEGPIQVAGWINSPSARTLKVTYSERAAAQLAAMPEHEALRSTVTRLLEQDPRSTYLRRKLGNQFYTFRIDSLYVTVKFDDPSATVNVTTIQQAV